VECRKSDLRAREGVQGGLKGSNPVYVLPSPQLSRV